MNRSFADRLRAVLQGEPLRAISYGASAVVWVSANALYSLGLTSFEPPSFDASIAAVGGAVIFVTEIARRFVYSPITVERVIEAAREMSRNPR